MEFESQLGIFSPDGRLIQVEYAQNASAQGGIIVVQVAGPGIQIAYENRQANSLLLATPKIHAIDADRHIYAIYSGLKPDSLLVTNKAIGICRDYKYGTTEDIPLRMLAKKIGEFKQRFTVDQGMRPLGLRTVLLCAENDDPQLFVIETDGNFSEYKSCSLGHKSDVVTAHLEANNGEGCIFKAMLEVLQKDTKKVRAWELSRSGLREIGEDAIRKAFDS